MNLEIYSKPDCPYCDRMKKVAEYLTSEKAFSVKVYTLKENFTKEEFYDKFGVGSTFPQVILNEKHLGGCIDSINYLQENNLL